MRSVYRCGALGDEYAKLSGRFDVKGMYGTSLVRVVCREFGIEALAYRTYRVLYLTVGAGALVVAVFPLLVCVGDGDGFSDVGFGCITDVIVVGRVIVVVASCQCCSANQ